MIKRNVTKVLFISTNKTTINEHRKLISKLDDLFEVYNIVYDNKDYWIYEEYKNNKKRAQSNESKKLNIFKKVLIVDVLLQIISYFKSYIKIKKRICESLKCIEFIKEEILPDVIVVPSDRSNAFILNILKYAKKNDILTTTVPVSFISGPERLIASRRNEKSYFTFLHIIFRQKYSKLYKRDIKTKKLVCYYRFEHLPILIKNNLLPENPWAFGSGLVTFIMVDSQRTKEDLVKLGTKPNKIYVTGHHIFDELFNVKNRKTEINKKINYRYKNHSTNKKIIFAVPHLAEHGLIDWQEHWAKLGLVCDNLQRYSSNFDIFISLHPKMVKQDYMFLEYKYGFKLLIEPLSSVLPVADYFIATFSSTVYWSVICNIRTLVLDIHGLSYKDFDWIKNIIVCNEVSKLNLYLKDFLCENQSVDISKKTVLHENFDGNCIDRIKLHLMRN